MMTTLTPILVLMPWALAVCDGAEFRTPMAITVIAGLGFSTVLTLIVIPTLYAGFDRLRSSGPTLSTAQRLDAELAQLRPEQLTAETYEAEDGTSPVEDAADADVEAQDEAADEAPPDPSEEPTQEDKT